MAVHPPCPICDGTATLLDVVDFTKNCEELHGFFLPLSGIPVYYRMCENCGFVFSTDFWDWRDEDFRVGIYNPDYIQVDPDYLTVRPQANAQRLHELLGAKKEHLRHLDYGGGNGTCSAALVANGWNSTSCDPFSEPANDITTRGRFNLITAFEVFEHVPRPDELMRRLIPLMDSACLVIFSTLTSDLKLVRNQRINWWYCAPRNGHISLYSKRSLELLGDRFDLRSGSFDEGLHCYFNQLPHWAQHLAR